MAIYDAITKVIELNKYSIYVIIEDAKTKGSIMAIMLAHKHYKALET